METSWVSQMRQNHRDLKHTECLVDWLEGNWQEDDWTRSMMLTYYRSSLLSLYISLVLLKSDHLEELNMTYCSKIQLNYPMAHHSRMSSQL